MRAALIARRFDVPGRVVTVEPFGAGNINDTYLAAYADGASEHPFILQRLRRAIFPDPTAIMRNLRVLTDHCRPRLAAETPEAGRQWRQPEIIRTQTGEDWIAEPDGDLWRALTFIDGARSFEHVRQADDAREVGVALGRFHRTVADLPVVRLEYALPGFHDTPRYLAALDAAATSEEGMARLRADADARAALAFAEARRACCSVLADAQARGDLRQRTTHGDPKVGNVMIDEASGRSVGMVDLDTVQPGLLHHDLGDAWRSACNPAGEDAEDLRAVRFDLGLFSALHAGYVSQAQGLLTAADRRHLFDCAHLLPLELGLRFLADHLDGDRYFKVRAPGHNLRRAQVQFRLVESIEAQEAAIRRILGDTHPDA